MINEEREILERRGEERRKFRGELSLKQAATTRTTQHETQG